MSLNVSTGHVSAWICLSLYAHEYKHSVFSLPPRKCFFLSPTSIPSSTHYPLMAPFGSTCTQYAGQRVTGSSTSHWSCGGRRRGRGVSRCHSGEWCHQGIAHCVNCRYALYRTPWFLKLLSKIISQIGPECVWLATYANCHQGFKSWLRICLVR